MRNDARELAFQLIYERLFVKEYFDEEFFATLTKEDDIVFAKSIVKNFEDNKSELEKIVSKHLIGYELDRVYKVDLALIYEALTEILYNKTPKQVAINEVVNLAKKFSTEKSSRFVNGVLSSIIKDLELN